MSPEMIAILTVGVVLAGLMLRGHYSLDKRMDGFDKRMGGFDERLRTLETGQTELKGTILGKLDFIERYIIARNLQVPETPPEPSGAPAAGS